VNAPNPVKAPQGAGDMRERLVVVGNGMAGCRAVEKSLPATPTALP
jgi:nitrite reductase (NADH) large subunit